MSTVKIPEFRFYYFTSHYEATIAFYKNILQLPEIRSWNRGEGDKGTIFQSPNGTGWIEIEEGTTATIVNGGLYIQVDDVDAWYEKLLNGGVKMLQPITDTSYGHRSFKFQDPNQLTISLFTYIE